jgi:protein-disulfide isomerase
MVYFSNMKKIRHFLKTTQGQFIGGLVVIIALLFAYYFYAMSQDKVGVVQEVVISDTDHVRGNQAGTVTLVEFGDFQCPACGAYEPIVRQATKDNPTNLKVVFRHFPLTQIHQNALLAAKASEAASLQGKFWEMHDMLYDNQKTWSESINARDFFMTYATTLGLDTKKFSADLNSSAVEEKIFAEYKEGIKLGIQGTPTFFLNGKMIENPQSADAFNALIKEASQQK